MADNPWVIIEQNEGLMVEYINSPQVDVVFIDYDEAADNLSYLMEKIEEVASGPIPMSHRTRIIENLIDVHNRHHKEP